MINHSIFDYERWLGSNAFARHGVLSSTVSSEKLWEEGGKPTVVREIRRHQVAVDE